jgi:tetratricopeptide (TPR) repeat protein
VSAVALLAVVGLVLLLSGHATPTGAGWVLANLGLFLGLLALLIWAHEAGHALAAWLLGLRIYRVCIGRGPPLFAWRVRRTLVEVKAVPVAGAVYVGFPDGRCFRLKHFLLFLAGPLANAVLLALALMWLPPREVIRQASVLPSTLLPGLCFVAGNVFLLLVSLVPCTVTLEGVKMPTDGLALLLTPFLSRKAIEDKLALFFYQEGVELAGGRRYAEAARRYEDGLARYPDSWMNRSGLGNVLIPLGEEGRARHHLLTLLSRPDLPPGVRLIVLENLATANLALIVRGQESAPAATAADPQTDDGSSPGERADDLLREADQLSLEALDRARSLSLPNLASYRGTRGCVLIEMGKVEEGLVLLREAFEELQHPWEKAFCAGFLAWAAARRGDWEKSRRYLDLARRSHPGCVGLERVTRELANGQGQEAEILEGFGEGRGSCGIDNRMGDG